MKSNKMKIIRVKNGWVYFEVKKGYKLRCLLQKILWCIGIAIHNNIDNECTPDFNCCNRCGRFAWIKKQT